MIQKIGLPEFGAFASDILPPPVEASLAGVPGGSVPLPVSPPIPPPAVAPAFAATVPPPIIQQPQSYLSSLPPIPPQAPRHFDLAQAIGPLAAFALALSGHPNAATGAAEGAIFAEQQRQREAQVAAELELRRQQEARLFAEQERMRKAQEAAATAAAARLEQERQQRIASVVIDASKSVRQFQTKGEYDDFVDAADALATQYYGARPGAVRSAVPPFVPQKVQARAKQTLDQYRKLMSETPQGYVTAPDGKSLIKQAPLPSPDKLIVQFDIDGDGKPEQVPFRDLEQLAGEAMYDSAGNRLVPAPPGPPKTYGDVFGVARGTVLADKPLPTTGKGAPDYSRAITDLRGLNLLPSITERRQARTDAQQHARDELYSAMLEPGTTEADLAARFSAPFSQLGLTYRAEAAKLRHQLFSVGKQTVGPEDLPPQNPTEYIDLGRSVLGGNVPSAPAAAPVAAPAPAVTRPSAPAGSGRGARPGAAPVAAGGSDARLRAAARSVLIAEANRRGELARTVTEDVVTAFLNTPGNREKLQAMVK